MAPRKSPPIDWQALILTAMALPVCIMMCLYDAAIWAWTPLVLVWLVTNKVTGKHAVDAFKYWAESKNPQQSALKKPNNKRGKKK